MPDKLAAEFELYPGATVTDTTDSPMVVQAVLDCGEASKQEVFDFYKEQVTKGDWKHLVEREVKGKTPPHVQQSHRQRKHCRGERGRRDYGHHQPHEKLYATVQLSRRAGVLRGMPGGAPWPPSWRRFRPAETPRLNCPAS